LRRREVRGARDGRRPAGRLGTALLALGGVLLAPGVVGQEPPPFESGLVERTEVALLLVDVEVRDEEGRPIRGLTAADFDVLIDGQPSFGYSVDDLCACDDGLSQETAVASETAERATTETDPPIGGAARVSETTAVAGRMPQPEPPRFVLYFDFSLLQTDGRAFAREEALRWLRESHRPGDLVMVVAHASSTGVRVVRDFTEDPSAIEAAIERSHTDGAFLDAFAMARDFRIDNCCRCCAKECRVPCGLCTGCARCLTPCLYEGARAEHRQGELALEAMKTLLQILEPVPGRKNLIAFHQNGTMFPARYYPSIELRVGDHVMLTDEVGAEANLARTALHVLHVGTEDGLGRNLGANLADATGGTYNRGPGDIRRTIDAVGRGCACIYRFGLVAPEGRSGRVFHVKVRLHGRQIDHRYRVTYLDRAERSMRAARTVLRDPEAADDLPLAAAIVPAAASGNSWDVTIEVAVSPDAMLHVPSAGRFALEWEVGALLVEQGSTKARERLALSRVSRSREEASRAAIVHEATLFGLRPGEYELRAFVRDRGAGVYGGATSSLQLPPTDEPGLAGPIVHRPVSCLRTSLPPIDDRGEPAVVRGAPESVKVAATGGPVFQGEEIEIATWLCDGRPGAEDVGRAMRWVEGDGRALFRFDEGRIEPAGACTRLVDVLDTTLLPPGAYTYHVRWHPEGDHGPVAGSVTFAIVSVGPSGDEP
jgi:VWFA-related protein